MTLLDLQDAITEALQEHDGNCEILIQVPRKNLAMLELEPLYANVIEGAVETCFVIQCREL